MAKMRNIAPCPMLSPVPVVMVSCCEAGEDAKPNIVTVAWTGTVNSNPPMVSISLKKERYSHHIIESSGEFVINLTDRHHLKALDFCGVKSGRDTDKWKETGLHPVKTPAMDYAPAIEECPVHICCKVRQVVNLGSHDMFIGEIVAVEAGESLFSPDGSMHLESAELVVYNHGVYQSTGDALGFFGYSLAKKDVFKARMASYKPAKKDS